MVNRNSTQKNTRITGVKTAEKITDVSLNEVADSIINESYRWFFVSDADWKHRGVVTRQGAIFVPNTRGSGGEIIAMVDDYVLILNDGRRTIVSDPNLKERIEAKDFSWFKA